MKSARYPGPVSALDGLDLAALDRHVRAAGIPRAGTLRAEKIGGGRSNLTFVVFDDTSTWVLRRPPLHGLTPSAHDMVREYRVVAALAGTRVPVPHPVIMCDDESVLGAPFHMVDYVRGRVIRGRADLDTLGDTCLIDSCVDELVKVLADLHALDPDAVGLGDIGKPSDYLQRQVRRWGLQWANVRRPYDRRDRDAERLKYLLAQAIPQNTQTSIVHGDYRIDNVILDYADPTVVRAVVDWELSTLGDPLSDVALMCVYRDPALDLIINQPAAWTSPLLKPPDEIAHRYSIVSGKSLSHWEFYLSLAYFKLAVIAAGIEFRARMATNSTAGDADAPTGEAASDRVGETVAPLIAKGLAALSG